MIRHLGTTGAERFLRTFGRVLAGRGVKRSLIRTWRQINEGLARRRFLALSDYVLAPRIIGRRVKLNPVWLMFALFAFGTLFGFIGLLLTVPLAAALGSC